MPPTLFNPQPSRTLFSNVDDSRRSIDMSRRQTRDGTGWTAASVLGKPTGDTSGGHGYPTEDGRRGEDTRAGGVPVLPHPPLERWQMHDVRMSMDSGNDHVCRAGISSGDEDTECSGSCSTRKFSWWPSSSWLPHSSERRRHAENSAWRTRP